MGDREMGFPLWTLSVSPPEVTCQNPALTIHPFVHPSPMALHCLLDKAKHSRSFSVCPACHHTHGVGRGRFTVVRMENNTIINNNTK